VYTITNSYINFAMEVLSEGIDKKVVSN